MLNQMLCNIQGKSVNYTKASPRGIGRLILSLAENASTIILTGSDASRRRNEQ